MIVDDQQIPPDIEKRLRKFVGRKKVIAHDTEIYHDLQIAGDDAADFIEEVTKDYNVNFKGFIFSEYFPNEYGSAFYVLAAYIGILDTGRKSFTVGHLMAVVQNHSWFEAAEQ